MLLKDGCWSGKAMLRQAPTRFSRPEPALVLVRRPLLLEQGLAQRLARLLVQLAFSAQQLS